MPSEPYDPKLSIFSAAEEHPDRIAVVDDGVELTYAELAGRARHLLSALATQGIGVSERGSRAAFVARPDLDGVLSLYALLELGMTVVPIHPKLTEGERDALLERAQVRLFLDDLDALLSSPDEPRLERTTDPAPPPSAAPLAVVFTSGSRGRPKGVVLTRRAFLAAAFASEANLGWQADDRWLLGMPLAHVGGLSIPIRTLIARRTLVLAPAGRFEATPIFELVERERVTLMSVVPTMLGRLLEDDRALPNTLRAILLGGAGASSALLEKAADRRWPVLTTYGLTESCGQVTTQRYGTVNRGDQGAGHPLPTMGIRIVDGEIQLRTASLFSGYFPPGAERPAVTSDGWFRTGDLGEFDAAGRLHVRGRADDRIITGGENVDPLEVEWALEAMEGIEQACVFGVPDETWGMRVAAALVPSGEKPPSDDRLWAAIREGLAPHKRPRMVAFFEVFPTLGPGKIDRDALRREAGERLRPIGALTKGEGQR